jgi:hypothetical protein
MAAAYLILINPEEKRSPDIIGPFATEAQASAWLKKHADLIERVHTTWSDCYGGWRTTEICGESTAEKPRDWLARCGELFLDD